jgi:hypothetical protein
LRPARFRGPGQTRAAQHDRQQKQRQVIRAGFVAQAQPRAGPGVGLAEKNPQPPGKQLRTGDQQHRQREQNPPAQQQAHIAQVAHRRARQQIEHGELDVDAPRPEPGQQRGGGNKWTSSQPK